MAWHEPHGIASRRILRLRLRLRLARGRDHAECFRVSEVLSQGKGTQSTFRTMSEESPPSTFNIQALYGDGFLDVCHEKGLWSEACLIADGNIDCLRICCD